ncbi:MAG TPA: hypothetical protein VGV90_14820 [Solirubrobacteraceae bacterium]|nr:hypothetical protein [Solirubrobacteraceae bacterium]
MTNSLNNSRELDARRGDGLDIRLLWNPADDTVTVTVADLRTEELFIIPVAAREALDAFQHPFAYAGAPADAALAVGDPR